MDDLITASLPEQIENEKSPEQRAIEVEQKQEDYSLAALKDHPGWKQIREKMEKDVAELKSGSTINISQYSNAELGEVFRTERMVADKLETYLFKIDNAVKAVVASNESESTG